jgi:predicted nucleic acid-binding protein
LLIATHALATESVLVTSDQAPWQIAGLQIEIWAV